MKKNLGKFAQIGCVVLMAVMVVLLFLPYWSFEGQETSISSLVWFPEHHSELLDWMADQTGSEVNLNNEIGTPILLTVLGIAGIVFLFIRRDIPITSFIGVLFGTVGIYGYLSSAVLRAGSLWGAHLTVCIVVLALSALGCVDGLAGGKNNRTAA